MTRNDNNEHHANGNEHYANGNRQADKDSHYPVKTQDLFTDPWMPGLVQVEFKDPSDSGVIIEDVDDSTERRKPSDVWRKDLLKVLVENRFSAWKPSFPLTYPWSRQSKEQAMKFYETSGRQKFVTFQFSDDADVVQIAAELRKVPEIERAKPVAKAVPPRIDDEYFGKDDQLVQPLAGGFENQWYAHRCNLPEALEQHVNGTGVIIAVIDWGFDVSHPDYSGAIELTKNIKYDNDTVGNGNVIHHGTGVLGFAGARLNSKGMVGFAPDSTLWAIQAGEDDEFNPEYWRDAIDFVRETDSGSNRKVIILEAQTALRGNIESDLTINQAIRDAIAADIVVCVPAGNAAGNAGKDDEGNDIPETNSILVGATTVDNVAIGKTGDRNTVYAPGDPQHDLTCTSLPDRYTNYFGGTSGAVAKVGGAVALLLEVDDSLSPAEVAALLRQSRKPVLSAKGGAAIPNAVLLDCGYSVYSCTSRKKTAPVLTKSSAMV